MENLYTIMMDRKIVINGSLPLGECMEIKNALEEKHPKAIVIVEMVNKPSKYDFINPT